LDLCPERTPWIEHSRDAEELTPCSITARYTREDEEVRDDEARRALEIAARVRQAVRITLEAEWAAIPEETKAQAQ
jgi:hypothetical protein